MKKANGGPTCGSRVNSLTDEWSHVTCGHCWAEVLRARLGAEEMTAVFDPAPEPEPEPDVEPEPWYAVGKTVVFDHVEYEVKSLTDDFGVVTLARPQKGTWGSHQQPAITVSLSMIQPVPPKPPKTFRDRVEQALPNAPDIITGTDEEWVTWICDLLADHIDSRQDALDTILNEWGLVGDKWHRDTLNSKIRAELRG